MNYLLVAILLIIFECLYFKIAKRYNIVDRPSKRGSSSDIVLRGGGVIFPIAALMSFVYDGFQLPLFIIGLLMVSVLSFVDDVHSLSPKLRLPVQLCGVLLMIAQLFMLSSEMPSLLTTCAIVVIALVVCTGAVNIYNFMDGINGIIGGYTLVVLAAIAYVLHVGDIGSLTMASVPKSILDLTAFAIMADLVFCFFNFRTKAKCFAGDVGSVSMAFIVLFLLGYIIFTSHDVSWLAFLVVFGVDGCLTILHRLMLHENISLPHRKHAYQIMANELHINHVCISILYMILQAICCVAYILLPNYGTLLAEIIILSLAYVLFMRKYYHLHVESGNA